MEDLLLEPPNDSCTHDNVPLTVMLTSLQLNRQERFISQQDQMANVWTQRFSLKTSGCNTTVSSQWNGDGKSVSGSTRYLKDNMNHPMNRFLGDKCKLSISGQIMLYGGDLLLTKSSSDYFILSFTLPDRDYEYLVYPHPLINLDNNKPFTITEANITFKDSKMDKEQIKLARVTDEMKLSLGADVSVAAPISGNNWGVAGLKENLEYSDAFALTRMGNGPSFSPFRLRSLTVNSEVTTRDCVLHDVYSPILYEATNFSNCDTSVCSETSTLQYDNYQDCVDLSAKNHPKCTLTLRTERINVPISPSNGTFELKFTKFSYKILFTVYVMSTFLLSYLLR